MIESFSIWRSRLLCILTGVVVMLAFCSVPTPISTQSEPEKDILETAIETKGFRILVALLKAADLDETLKGEGPFTIFAPTDTAFTKIPLPKIRELRNDPEGNLTNLLLFHAAEGRLTAVDIVDSIDQNTNSLNGLPLVFTEEDGVVSVNGAAIVLTDIQASNGVIHVIDSVLTPSASQEAGANNISAVGTQDEPEEDDSDTENSLDENADANGDVGDNSASTRVSADPDLPPGLLETADSSGNFTTLLAAIESANLVETLQGEGPFTIFAPSDSALATLPAGTVEALLDAPQSDLAEQLLLHVVSGEILATDLVGLANSELETVNGKLLPIRTNEAGLTVGGAVMLATNIQTRNGVIHVVDNMLIESTRTITDAVANSTGSAPVVRARSADLVETATAAGNFNTLVTALKASGLDEVLKTGGSFTIFAPTDQAFAALPSEMVDDMLADPSGALTDLLLYHTVEGLLPADYIMSIDGSALKSVGGDLLPINVGDDNRAVSISGAALIATDIMAANGLIHVIDRVMLKPDSAAASGNDVATEPTAALLVVPTVASTATPVVAPTAQPEPAGTIVTGSGDANCLLYYVVNPGDTLYAISLLYGTTTRVLMRINNLNNADDIKAGQILCVAR